MQKHTLESLDARITALELALGIIPPPLIVDERDQPDRPDEGEAQAGDGPKKDD